MHSNIRTVIAAIVRVGSFSAIAALLGAALGRLIAIVLDSLWGVIPDSADDLTLASAYLFGFAAFFVSMLWCQEDDVPRILAGLAGIFQSIGRFGRPMKRLVAETFGTFAMVFAGTGAITINDVTGGTITHVGVALTFGLVVLAMIYAVGDVSGAHLNPAVTLGFFAARRLEGMWVAPYVASQCLGAFLASVLLRLLFRDHATLGATIPAGPDLQSFTLELVLTCILMFVILSFSVGAKERGLVAGVAVGAVIALEAMFAGPICGASMNPARSLAPAVVSLHVQSLWVYLTAPTLGALLAVPLCRCVQEPGCCRPVPTPST